MINIPGDKKQWIQTNDSDVLGNLYSTYNCDFEQNKGKICCGDRLLLNTGSLNGTPIGFKTTSVIGSTPTIYTVAGAYVYKNTSGYPSGEFTQDSTTNTPTTCDSAYSDIEYGTTNGNGTIYVTTGTSETRFLQTGGSSWQIMSTVGSYLATSVANNAYPHLLCPYANRMYFTHGGCLVGSWDTVSYVTFTVSNTAISSNQITVPSNTTLYTGLAIKWLGNDVTGLTVNNYYYVIRIDSTHIKMASTQANAFAGTAITISGTPSSDSFTYPDTTFVDGFSISSPNTTSYTLALDPATNYISFIRPTSTRIWIGTINPRGGKGYVYEWDGASTTLSNSYKLDSSGALTCVIKDDIPYILNTNGEIQVWNGGTFKNLDEARIGIRGKFNRFKNELLFNPLNPTNDRFIHPNGMTLVNGRINLLVNTSNYNNFITEVPIPAGIWEYDSDVGLYHKHSPSYMQSSDTTFTDGGQQKVASAGAIAEINLPSTNSNRDGIFLAGFKYYTSATSTDYGVFFDNSKNSKQKLGSFITNKIYSPNVSEIWQKLFLTYRKFLSSDDEIVVKYRTEQLDSTVEGTITWTSAESFTTTAAISVFTEGDEVEILQGPGAGFTAHIESISVDSGTYTVIVDRTFTGVGYSTAIARFDKWNKCFTTTDTAKTWGEVSIGKISTWIQFKVWFSFYSRDEIEQLLIANTAHQPIK